MPAVSFNDRRPDNRTIPRVAAYVLRPAVGLLSKNLRRTRYTRCLLMNQAVIVSNEQPSAPAVGVSQFGRAMTPG